MSDFIREVNEEYRQDQFRDFLARYWIGLLLLVVLVLSAAGAWRGYDYWRQQQAEAAGERYFKALDLAASDPKAAVAALDALGTDGPAGYRLLARFRAAGELGRTDPAAAIKAFDVLAGDAAAGPELRDVARLRAGLLSVDADPAALRGRLEPLADANSPYRSVAREMLAVAALKRGDDADARRWAGAILGDPAAALDSRQRAALYVNLVESAAKAPTPGETPAPPAAPPAPPAAPRP